MWMLPSIWTPLVVLLAATLTSALSVTGPRLLLVVDQLSDKVGYSTFLGDLEARGFHITVESPKSSSLSLFYLGDRAYDHIVVLPSALKALGPNLSPAALLKFVDARGNVLIALTSTTPAPTSLVGFLSELGVTLPSEKTGVVVDHFNYDAISAVEKHDVLLLHAPTSRSGIRAFFGPAVGSSDENLIAFPRGTGHVLGAGPLLSPVLRAPRTAYLYNPQDQALSLDPEDLFAAGEQLGLVSVSQARNSARVAVLGSAEMLTDFWFDATVQTVAGGQKTQTWNREFARRISGWAFQEIGVLRVNSVEHGTSGPNGSTLTAPSVYRVKNETTYKISISEYSWDTWKPFVLPDGDDLQLEFSMLSPFYRLKLIAGPTGLRDQTVFSTTFTLPDQHGIFNFMVNYKRPFLTNIEEKRTVSVRHFAHDEWPRSYALSGAWPGMMGVLVTVIGFVSFCAIWMYHTPATRIRNAKKIQ